MNVKRPKSQKTATKPAGATKRSQNDSKLEESKGSSKISLKSLEKLHQENKLKNDKKGHIANTEALLEKSKNKQDILNEKIEKLSRLTEDSKVKRAEMAESIKRNKNITHTTAKEIAKSMNYIINVDDIEMPQTILQTTDEISVMETIQTLIKDNVDYSDDTSPDFKRFNDPEFKPTDSAIYLQDDLTSSEKKEFIDDYLNRIQWLRPHQISEDPNFDNMPGSKVPDLRIIQGQLKDNWFLSALSLIRTEDFLFQTLTLDHQFDRFRTYGMYVFKFFKNGAPYYVIIDDKLP